MLDRQRPALQLLAERDSYLAAQPDGYLAARPERAGHHSFSRSARTPTGAATTPPARPSSSLAPASGGSSAVSRNGRGCGWRVLLHAGQSLMSPRGGRSRPRASEQARGEGTFTERPGY
jgi:hypothetical protein